MIDRYKSLAVQSCLSLVKFSSVSQLIGLRDVWKCPWHLNPLLCPLRFTCTKFAMKDIRVFSVVYVITHQIHGIIFYFLLSALQTHGKSHLYTLLTHSNKEITVCYPMPAFDVYRNLCQTLQSSTNLVSEIGCWEILPWFLIRR